MAQYSLPNGNSSSGTWTEGVGDADGDYFDELDEGFGAGRGTGSGPDGSSTFWKSANNPNPDALKVTMSTVTDPVSSSGHIARYEHGKNGTGGVQIDNTLNLLEGASTRATHTYTNVTTFTSDSDTLTSGEADSITDYSNLLMEISSQIVGGGAARRGGISAFELEVPDASTAVFMTANRGYWGPL